MVIVFTFSVFKQKYHFRDKFDPKNKNCQLEEKFVTNTNSNMQNSAKVFTASVFDQEHPFWTKLVQKVFNEI